MQPDRFSCCQSLYARAAQAYFILVGDAALGRLVTYDDLATRMGMLPPSMGRVLDRMAAWTKENELADLASIVVGTGSGRSTSFDNPSDPRHPYGLTFEQWPSELAKVRETRWFDIIPPTPKQIEEAWVRFRPAEV